MMNSPLGKYAAPASAIASLGIIGVYLLSLVFGTALAVNTTAQSNLQALAFLAAGALFGSAVAVNGYKAPLNEAHNRIDALELATGIPTHTPPTSPTP